MTSAKRKGDKWYIGAITNNAETEREFNHTLDFLNDDREYTVTAFTDGPNAHRQAMDYHQSSFNTIAGQTGSLWRLCRSD